MPDFAGLWTLVDWRRSGDGPFPLDRPSQFGEGARGTLCYEAGGFVSAFLMRADWGTSGQVAGPGFIAYAGRWRVAGAEVLHEVEFASIPAWVGTTLVREWSFTPQGELVLLTPWRESAGGRTRDRLTWRRRTG